MKGHPCLEITGDRKLKYEIYILKVLYFTLIESVQFIQKKSSESGRITYNQTSTEYN